MHYLGMAAMRVSPPVEYDISLVAASIGIAFVASLVALWLAFRLRRRYSRGAVFAKLGSAVVMGLGIAAMHYTGIAAARFAPGTVSLEPPSLVGLDDAFLAELIGLAALGLLGVTVVLTAFDAARAARTEAFALALQARNAELRAAALYDALTGLPNRMLLDERLIQAVRRSERSGKPFAVMFVDLDRFKAVNDTYGHVVGDRLLEPPLHPRSRDDRARRRHHVHARRRGTRASGVVAAHGAGRRQLAAHGGTAARRG
jgi:predicted signal transduction protein with EAL and GGDEF domain